MVAVLYVTASMPRSTWPGTKPRQLRGLILTLVGKRVIIVTIVTVVMIAGQTAASV